MRKLFLIMLFSAALWAARPAWAVTCTPPSGMVAWWKLDETSGSTMADSADTNPGTARSGRCQFGGGSPPDSATAYWKMDETSGVTVADSADINDGTATTSSPSFANSTLNSGLVGYWGENEDSGTTVASAVNTPALNGTSTAAITTGKVGNVRNFDGGTKVSVPNNTLLMPTSMTISAWINPASLPQAPGYDFTIVDKRDDATGKGGYVLQLKYSGNYNQPQIVFYNGGSATSNFPTATIPIGSWTHILVTASGTSGTVYVNGTSIGNYTYYNALGDCGTPCNVPFLIAYRQDWYPFVGKIDEVGLWNRVLTSTEITSLKNGDYLSGAPTIVAGKINNARRFNGAGDYIAVNSLPAYAYYWSFSVSAWVNFASVNKGSDNTILGHGSATTDRGLHLGERAAKAYLGFYGDDLAGSRALSANTWYHLVFTYDNATKRQTIYVNGTQDTTRISTGTYQSTATNTQIGQNPWSTGNRMAGIIDEVGIWPRALSAPEVSALYNSGTGLSCTRAAGPASITGRVNNARSFDSSLGQYISVNSNSNLNPTDLTLEAWVYPSGSGPVVFKQNTSYYCFEEYYLSVSSGPKANFSIGSPGCGTSGLGLSANLVAGQWNHIAATFSNTSKVALLYINGNQAANTTWNGSINGATTPIGIGRYSQSVYWPSYFTGQIDEVRIFNRVLSPAEIAIEAQPGYKLTCDSWSLCTGPCGAASQSQSCYNSYCSLTSYSQSCNTLDTIHALDGLQNAPQAVNVCANCKSGGCTQAGAISSACSSPSLTDYSFTITNNSTYTLTPQAVSGYNISPNPYDISVACSDVVGPRFWYLSGAGVVSSNAVIDYGSGGVSQGGVAPGYRLENYTSITPLTKVNYNELLRAVLKNARSGNPLTEAELKGQVNCQNGSGLAATTTNTNIGNTGTSQSFDWYCYTNAAGNFDSQLSAAINAASTNVKILYPYQFTGTVTATAKTLAAGDNIITFVPGTLQVDGNITVPAAANNASAVFILATGGDLNVKSTVSELDGLYIFPGAFNDNYESAIGNNLLLSGLGALIGTGTSNWTLQRTVPKSTGPAESWTYQPKYLTIYNNILSAAQYTWRELPPQ